jgi:hypothetical protein
VRGLLITIPETWDWIKTLQIKGKSPYSKLSWGEVDTQPDPSPFVSWLEGVVNDIIVDSNKAIEAGHKNVRLPQEQRALLAFERLTQRRAGLTDDDEATCPLTEDEADRKLAREQS